MQNRRRRRKNFKYELMWETHEGFPSLIAETWQQCGRARTIVELHEKMSAVAGKLGEWGAESFGHVREELKRLNAELAKLRSDPRRVGPSYVETKVVESILELNYREEIMWKQRSRITWLAEGDKNTRFFHLRASQRRKRIFISSLKKPDGQVTQDEGEMAELTSGFYRDLYSSEGTEDMDSLLAVVPRKVTEEMNAKMDASYSKEEIKTTLFQMFPTKALGPDGFPAHFFQRHWNLCGEEVCAVVLRVLEGEDDPSVINSTCIVLIPKVEKPVELGQYRPISLCNVIYKIASKTVANRLRIILPDVISEEQSAFVPGRLITDNILTAYECLHFMKKKRASDSRCCAVKLDMKKAYDRVEWEYLRRIMITLGFSRGWVNMIMRLVSSVSFSVLFNSDRLESFKPTRGIRQGDPISPYLFLLTAKGILCLLKSRVQSSSLSGILVAQSAPMVIPTFWNVKVTQTLNSYHWY